MSCENDLSLIYKLRDIVQVCEGLWVAVFFFFLILLIFVEAAREEL